MLKKAGLIILLIVIFGIMIVFSYLNTGDVEVNLDIAGIQVRKHDHDAEDDDQ